MKNLQNLYKKKPNTLKETTGLHSQISRKTFLILIAQMGIFASIALRLLHLQIINFKKYLFLSNKNAHVYSAVYSPREKIKDRKDRVIAENFKSKKLVLYPINQESIEESIKEISKLLDNQSINTQKYIEKISKAFKINKYDEIIISRKLSRAEFLKISYNIHRLKFFSIQDSTLRKYTFKDTFCHVAGYVSIPNKQEAEKIKQQTSTSILSDVYIGKYGLEKSFNSNLSGKYGIKCTEKDSTGKHTKTFFSVKPKQGNEVKTTLDANVQEFCLNVFKNNKSNGSLVILDIKTGDTISMVSYPSFDPNMIIHGINENVWNSLKEQQYNGVFINKTIGKQYPPGSTFKLISYLALLENGANPNLKYNCTGEHLIGNKIYHCWKKNGHGILNLTEALSHSCNCYLYNLASKIDTDIMLNIENNLTNYKSEIYPLFNQKLGNSLMQAKQKYKQWSLGDTVNFSIGQGYNEKTPMQLALMSARIASRSAIEPKLIFSNHEHSAAHLNISDTSINMIIKSMSDSINNKNSPAYGFRSTKYQIAGKTGTAQVTSKRLLWDDMKKNKISHKLKDHGLFTGFGPVEDPRFAIGVVMEHGISGLSSAIKPGIECLEFVINELG